MSDQTHYQGCWEDPKHHACALREIERLRQRDETPRCPQCETLRLEARSMRAEIERLHTDYNLLSDDYKQLVVDNERLRAEIGAADRVSNAFAETACKRGARMQLMREWMIKFSGPSKTIWWYFRRDTPDAFDWFYEDGTPR